MPNLEWDAPQTLVSPYLTLDLNMVLPLAGRDDGFYFLVKPDNYQIVPGKFRPVTDSISQADGSSLQPPYIDGLVATLTVEYWVAIRGQEEEKKPACAEDLRLMNQMLMGVLNSLRSYSASPGAQQRYLWTPTGLGDRRMLTDVILASWPAPSIGVPEVSMTFELATPFPYAIDSTEIDTAISDGDYVAVDNNGNAAQSPVIEVAGDTSAFAIENMSTGEIVQYDGAEIVGGKTAEIDFFRGSIILKPDNTDLIAGLDPNITDFWLLGADEATTIFVRGADIVVHSNNAWV